MKISALAALVAALSILAVSTPQAGGAAGGIGGEFRHGQSQGQKGGHHPSGTQHRGGHNSAAPKRTKTVAPARVFPICSPFCTGVDHPW